MRVRALSGSRLAALIGAVALAACAGRSPVAIHYDKSHDFSALGTWDWIEGDAVLVYAPARDTAAMQLQLSELIASELVDRGIARAAGEPTLRVAALLTVYRTHVPFRKARAVQTVYSYHSGGNYEVQVDEVEKRPVDRVRLAIYVTGPGQERILWQSEVEQQYFDDVSDNLRAAVELALGEFPPHSTQEPLAPSVGIAEPVEADPQPRAPQPRIHPHLPHSAVAVTAAEGEADRRIPAGLEVDVPVAGDVIAVHADEQRRADRAEAGCIHLEVHAGSKPVERAFVLRPR